MASAKNTLRRPFARYLVALLLVTAAVIVALLLRHKEQSNPTDVAVDDKPQVYVQRGTGNAVPYTAWSPDGRYILSSDREVVILWDAMSGREIRRLQSSARSEAPVAFLPDGKRFLLGRSDSTVQLWDIATFTELTRFHMDAPVRSLVLSVQGDKFLCTTMSSTTYLWDMKSGRERRRFPTAPFGSIVAAMSPDGRSFLIQGTGPKTVTLWNAENGQKLRDFELTLGTPTCAAFSPDGQSIACGSGDAWTRFLVRFWGNQGRRVTPDSAEIRVWNVSDGKPLCHIRPDSAYVIFSIQFEPDGRHLITTSVDSTVSWWDLETCRLSSRLTSRGSLVLTAIVSADCRRLLTAGDPNMRIWNMAGQEVERSFAGKALYDGRAGFSHDGTKICVAPWAGGTYNREFAQHLLVWDAHAGRRLDIIDPQPKQSSYAFSANCQQALIVEFERSENEGRLQFWSAEQGLMGRTKNTPEVLSGSWDFTPDGRYAAANVDDSSYVLWEMGTGREVRRIYCSQPPYPTRWLSGLDALSLSDDGRYAVVGRQPAGLLLDFATGISRVIRSSQDSTTPLSDCSISSDGKLAIFTWYDHSVDVWDGPGFQLLHTYIAENFVSGEGFLSSVRISHDKSTFAASRSLVSRDLAPGPGGAIDTFPVASPRSGGIWDLPTGKLLREFGQTTGGIQRVVFSDDERFLISPTIDNGVRIFNAQSGKEIVYLLSFENGEWLAVTPEGYYTSSLNGDAFLNVRTGTMITGIEPYRATFYQPAVVEAALRLRDSEAAISEMLGCRDTCTTIENMPEIAPPTLITVYPRDCDTLRSTATTLAFHVEDRRFPIADVRVFVNGRPAAGYGGTRVNRRLPGASIDFPRSKHAFDLKVPIRLDHGDNQIVLTAFGKSEAVRELHVVVQPSTVGPESFAIDTVWILAIGVNKYDDQDVRSLSYCENDAQELIHAFEAQEGVTCHKVMNMCITDNSLVRPNYTSIVANMDYLRQADERDLAVLFMAGHGESDNTGNFYFLPSDAQVSGLHDFDRSTAISGSLLLEAIDVPARRLVFLDACHSGDAGLDLIGFSRRLKDQRALVLASSDGNTASIESDSLRHGVFSYALIRGLEGEDGLARRTGTVTALNLVTYVRDHVSQLTGNKQNPVFWTPEGLGSLVLAFVPLASSSP
jgi:WD40 repeat protein